MYYLLHRQDQYNNLLFEYKLDLNLHKDRDNYRQDIEDSYKQDIEDN